VPHNLLRAADLRQHATNTQTSGYCGTNRTPPRRTIVCAQPVDLSATNNAATRAQACNTHRATAGLRSGGSAAAYWRSSGAQCGLARCPPGIVLGSASASGAASGSARLIRRSAGSCWPSPGAGRMPWPSPPTSPPLHVVWTMLCSHSAC
jgi:hypothetical protein